MKHLFNLLNTHFESFLAFEILFVIGFVVIFAAARLREKVLQKKIINLALFYVLLLLQAVLTVMTVFVVVANFRPKPPLDFSAQILPSTYWVKEDLTVYFIDGNKLVSIQADGSGRKTVYKAGDAIRQYIFSPEGKNILIVTEKDLVCYNQATQSARTVDSLKVLPGKDTRYAGNFDRIAWDPTGRRFGYRLAQWSPVASSEQWKVYIIDNQKNDVIPTRALTITNLVWGHRGRYLYGVRFRKKNDAPDEETHELIVHKMTFPDLQPVRVAALTTTDSELPVRQLARRGIRLAVFDKEYAFGHTRPKRTKVYSSKGAVIGIDRRDTLYYISRWWWRKRLYRVPRVPDVDRPLQYQYRGGRLAIGDLRFLPSGRYVMMEHYFWGILILDPISGQVGILDNQQGNTFGWFPG